ncbi:adenylate/guanylate cyclase domain-containing protein [Eudoraea sp.]|uniref:adenylate/guanylate cyclase domain-containing protein n=4 Tax=Eudoraea sp. TaxID=1979955 RepID=UPI003C769A4A
MIEQRRLSTVLFADIVGYTSLMQSDEKRAMLFLNHFKELVENIVPAYQGEIIQYYGDAVLLTFESATAGVECAIELQQAFIEKEIPIRIGMHLGDVIFKNDNVFGDGVNIASRIESMGIPGCLLVSKTIRDQLVNKGDFLLHSLGPFEFKNVEEPMEVFAITNEGMELPKREQIKGKLKDSEKKPAIKWTVPIFIISAWLPIELFNYVIERYSLDPVLLDLFILVTIFGLPATLIFSYFKGRFNRIAVGLQILNGIAMIAVLFYFLTNPLALNPGKLRLIKLYEGKSSVFKSLNSLAVLPFSNNLGDDSQKYLLAGMHFGLINEIGQLGSIHVISETSSLPYQNTNKSIRKIAKELNVDAIIETSLSRIDTIIELRINLIKAFPDEQVLWNHSYTTSLNELPNLYKEVTKNVALKINKALRPEEEQKLQPKRVPNPGAYEAFLRGSYYMGFLTPEGFELSKKQFKKAIEIDPLFAPSYSGISGILGSQRQMGYVSGAEVNLVIDSLQKKAYELDKLNSVILMGRAADLTWSKFNWKEAEKFFKKSLDINPNAAEARTYYAHFLMIQNRWEEAWEQMKYAIELDPENPWVISFSAMMYFIDGKVFSAAKHSERLIRMAPNHPMATAMLLGKYIFQKNYDQAIVELKKDLKRTRATDLESVIDNAYKNGNFNEAVRSSATYLEDYSKEHFVAPSIIHSLYKIIDDREKQLEWMLKMFEVNDPNLPYFAIRSSDPIQKDPTYVQIMKEIGLW